MVLEIIISFLKCDNGIAVMQGNSLILRRYLTEVLRSEVSTMFALQFQMIEEKIMCVCVKYKLLNLGGEYVGVQYTILSTFLCI